MHIKINRPFFLMFGLLLAGAVAGCATIGTGTNPSYHPFPVMLTVLKFSLDGVVIGPNAIYRSNHKK